MNKDELVAKAKEELGGLEQKFAQIKQKGVEESNEIADDFQNAISDLGEKYDQAKAKCAEIADVADEQWEELKESLEADWNDTKKMFDEGWDNLSDSVSDFLSDDTKTAFLIKAQNTIDAQKGKIEQLKQKAKEGGEEIAEEYQKAIDALEAQLEEAKAKCQEIADVADHRWDYMKSSAEKIWDETIDKVEDGWDDLTDSVKKLFS